MDGRIFSAWATSIIASIIFLDCADLSRTGPPVVVEQCQRKARIRREFFIHSRYSLFNCFDRLGGGAEAQRSANFESP